MAAAEAPARLGGRRSGARAFEAGGGAFEQNEEEEELDVDVEVRDEEEPGGNRAARRGARGR